ncbi:MAG TPA: DNA-3-methyladenine glycosylase [Candidatus Paceibacterota bacterium]
MNRKILNQEFFDRKTLVVAKDLLGKYLVRRVRLHQGYVVTKEQITEVEAYIGPHDLACHSSKGRTKRTEIMYCKAGTLYVYFVYGMYWMLNVVTEEKDYPSAILIRGTEQFKGPGVLTRELKITGELNGKPANKKTGLWFESDLSAKGGSASGGKILRLPRVGVNYAGPIWANKKYRFVLKG